MKKLEETLGTQYPIFGGAMYPCSNPELVAAVSEAGGLGVVQPLTLTYVFGYDFKEGLGKIRHITQKPVGLNLLIEQSSQRYLDRMWQYMQIALEEGVRVFVTALGNPRKFVDQIHKVGGVVFHDVTEKKWAEKALDAGVDGLICVNHLAGGHAGHLSPEHLMESLQNLNTYKIAAGGVSHAKSYQSMLDLGYDGVQIGTRLIATHECLASPEYKQAILHAKAQNIVLSEKITGVPVSIINTPRVQAEGVKAGKFAKNLLNHPRLKHWVRLFYSIRSFYRFKQSMVKRVGYQDYWQAGKSVEWIDSIISVEAVVRELTRK